MEGWDGTTRRRAERPDAPALAALRRERRQVDLGRRSRRRPPRRPRQPEPAADVGAQRAGARRRSATSSSPRIASDSARTPTAISISASSSRTRAASRARTSGTVRSRSPRTLNPILDKRFPGGVALMSDDDIDRLIDDFIEAARRAYAIGFQFVDIKHCHGYFGHELLSARDRDGPLRRQPREPHALPLRRRRRHPRRGAGPRHRRAAVGHRQRAVSQDRRWAGRAGDRRRRLSPRLRRASTTPGVSMRALDDGREFLRLLQVARHPLGLPDRRQSLLLPARRPAGALPADRRLRAARGSAARRRAADSRDRAALKAEFPDMVFVGSAYTYLQEWLPNVGAVHAAPRHDRLRRPRPHDAVVSRARRRRARGPAAHAQARVPDVQRLHDRSAARPRLGLLSARSALRRPSRTRRCSKRPRRPPAT